MTDDINGDCCPDCGFSLIGEAIPDENRPLYGEATHYRREIGIEMRGVYDGVLFWVCPACNYAWPRFTGESGEDRLTALSARYSHEYNTGPVNV